MSQEDVLKILKELGGEATTGEVSKKALRKYPNRTLYKYVSTRLKQLQLWNIVGRKGDRWFIK